MSTTTNLQHHYHDNRHSIDSDIGSDDTSGAPTTLQFIFHDEPGMTSTFTPTTPTTNRRIASPSSQSAVGNRFSQFWRRIYNSPQISSLFLPSSSLTPEQQQGRRRFMLRLTVTLLIICIHLIIIIMFFNTYNRYIANKNSGGGSGGDNPWIPGGGGGEEEGEGEEGSESEEEARRKRTLFTYLITIPNLFFLACIGCCVFSMCMRKLAIVYAQRSNSAVAQLLRIQMTRAGVYVGGGASGDSDLDSLFRSNRYRSGDDSGDENERPIDQLYRLQLAMVDRDFDESDYEALLALDDNTVARNRIVSNDELKRVLVSYKIPPVVWPTTTTTGNDNKNRHRHNEMNLIEMDEFSSVENNRGGTIVDLSSMEDDSSSQQRLLVDGIEEDGDDQSRRLCDAIIDHKTINYCTEAEAHRLLEKQCVICLEDYKPEECISRLRTCTHEFHTGCIAQALKVKANCPICKIDAV